MFQALQLMVHMLAYSPCHVGLSFAQPEQQRSIKTGTKSGPGGGGGVHNEQSSSRSGQAACPHVSGMAEKLNL